MKQQIFGFELGANTPANAFHAGMEGYKAGKALFNPDPNAKEVHNKYNYEQDLQRLADLISKNNNFQFARIITMETQQAKII